MEDHSYQSKIEAGNSIRFAFRNAEHDFEIFLIDYELYNSTERDIFSEFYTKFEKLNNDSRKENGFYNDYFKEIAEIKKNGKADSYLANSIFVSKFNDKLDWNEVMNIAAKSIGYGLMINKLNEWKIERDEKLGSQKKVIENIITISEIPIETEQFNGNTIIEGLSVLAGKWTGGNKIMKADEYQRVIDYFQYTLDNKKLTENIKQVCGTMATNEFIQYTFYLFWKKNKKIITREMSIAFLHAVFEQFSNTKTETTYHKFSTKFNGYEDFILNLPK